MNGSETHLRQLTKRLAASSPNDRATLQAASEEAKRYCLSGLGTPYERFYWEVLTFYIDSVDFKPLMSELIQAPLESLRLCAMALAEFDNVFESQRGPLRDLSAMKFFTYFGILSSSVEALTIIAEELKLENELILQLKRSKAWEARRNVTHIHTRQKALKTDLFSRFKRHDFRLEALSSRGFRYRSRFDAGEGYRVRGFHYDAGISELAFHTQQILTSARSVVI
jgi:hypothetical protein